MQPSPGGAAMEKKRIEYQLSYPFNKLFTK